MKTSFLAFTLFCIASLLPLQANNLQISNMYLRGQDDVQGFKLIRMDVSWENSWRTSTYESNHDAVWIFAKYRYLWQEGVWRHATLNVTGHTAPAGATVTVPSDGRGAFVYRSADGSGAVNYADLELRWNYEADGLNDDDSVEICVFGIEMVYVPQGSFYVGDGAGTSSGQFIQGTTTNSPFQITSEGAIVIGNAGTDQLWGTSVSGTNQIGAAGSLPAAFPKGYGSFYVMKYGISQGQYRDFLNKLDRTQQATRCLNITGNGYFFNNSTSPVNRNGIRQASDPGSTLPRTYDCDFNNNGVGNEAGDGEHIECNFLSYYDLQAYADWSGLRPMTELEFEKACRGTRNAYPDEKAWGNSNVTAATGIMNSGFNNESPTNPTTTNVAYNNSTGVQGPLRVGSFAGATTTREQAGATYYGVMEMSGNGWEWVVDVARATGRTYTGTHGDGVLSASGDYNQSGWPNRGGIRGGSWSNNTLNTLNVSDRSSVVGDYSTQRYSTTNGRVVRTAP